MTIQPLDIARDLGIERYVVGSPVDDRLLVVPAFVSHRVDVLDGETYEATHLHANDLSVTEWLE